MPSHVARASVLVLLLGAAACADGRRLRGSDGSDGGNIIDAATSGIDLAGSDAAFELPALVGYGSSGDLVSVRDATYATVSGAFASTEGLAKVDPNTGNATLIGDTGVANIWGLGYWKQKVFGFTESDGIVIIDINTGHSTPVAGSSSVSWYGAGVTTAAPTTVN